MLGVIAWGEDIGQAIGNPRAHNQNTGDTEVEPDYPSTFVQFLESTNHIIRVKDGTIAVVQGIVQQLNGMLSAASDWRKGGIPAGF